MAVWVLFDGAWAGSVVVATAGRLENPDSAPKERADVVIFKPLLLLFLDLSAVVIFRPLPYQVPASIFCWMRQTLMLAATSRKSCLLLIFSTTLPCACALIILQKKNAGLPSLWLGGEISNVARRRNQQCGSEAKSANGRTVDSHHCHRCRAVDSTSDEILRLRRSSDCRNTRRRQPWRQRAWQRGRQPRWQRGQQ